MTETLKLDVGLVSISPLLAGRGLMARHTSRPTNMVGDWLIRMGRCEEVEYLQLVKKPSMKRLG
jgi:hypothetical protein